MDRFDLRQRIEADHSSYHEPQIGPCMLVQTLPGQGDHVCTGNSPHTLALAFGTAIK